MKIPSFLLGCVLCLSALQAEELPSSSLDVRERLAFTWTNGAKRLDAGKRVIYYRGDAKRDATSGPAARVTVTGDVLLIDGDSVLAASEVSLPEDGTGTVSVKGPSKAVLGSKDVFVQTRVKELTAKR